MAPRRRILRSFPLTSALKGYRNTKLMAALRGTVPEKRPLCFHLPLIAETVTGQTRGRVTLEKNKQRLFEHRAAVDEKKERTPETNKDSTRKYATAFTLILLEYPCPRFVLI